MDGLLRTIFPCLPIKRGIQLTAEKTRYQQISKKVALQTSPRDVKKAKLSSAEAASSIVSAMLDAEKISPSLQATIESLVHQAGGWSNYLAGKLIAALEAVLRAGKPMNAPMQEAYNKAYEDLKVTKGFVHDHPDTTAVFCTVIALGVLVILAPYLVEWLGFCAGFGELGPVEGTSRFLDSMASTKVY